MSKKKRLAATAWDWKADNDDAEEVGLAQSFDEAFKPEEFSQAQPAEKKKEAPKAEAEQKEVEERIKNLYPDRFQQKIAIDRLIPAPNAWNFFPEIDRQTMKDLMQSILDYGLLHPIIVWEQENGDYMILGGHNRTRACQNLIKLFPDQAERFNQISCTVYLHDSLDDVEARKIIIMDNTTQRQKESTAIMARSVIGMNRLMLESRQGKRNRSMQQRKRVSEVIGESLGISSSSVKGYRRLEKLIPDFWNLLDSQDEDRLTLRNALVIALLSEELQRYMLSKKYYLENFTPVTKKLLRSAKDSDDVDQAFNDSYEVPVTAKVRLPRELPEDYMILPIVGSYLELASLKKVISEEILTSNSYSDLTKSLITKILKYGDNR